MLDEPLEKNCALKMQLRNILLVIKRDLSKTYRYISDNAEIKLKTMFQQVD